MSDESKELLKNTFFHGLGPLVKEDDIFLFHNREIIIFSIKKHFSSWITIYNKDPRILTEEYPDIMEAIKKAYLNPNENIEINQDTPDIIKRDPTVIESYLIHKKDSIFQTFSENDDLESLGKLVGKICGLKGFSMRRVEKVFDNNAQGILYSERFQKGLIEANPTMFLELHEYYIDDKYYPMLKETFMDNISRVDFDIEKGYIDNYKVEEDEQLIEFLFHYSHNLAFKVMNVRMLYQNNKSFIIRMFKEHKLTLDDFTPVILRKDPELQKISFANDKESVVNFKEIIDKDIILYIVENQIEDARGNISLAAFNIKEVQDTILDLDEIKHKELAQLLIEKESAAIRKGISPENMKKFAMDAAIDRFEKMKRGRAAVLANVRGYLFNILKTNDTIKGFKLEFALYNDFFELFGLKFDTLLEKYYKDPNNIEIQNQLSDLTRKFGDLYKQSKIKQYYEDAIRNVIRSVYKINKDSVQVKKRINEKLQMKKFKDLYEIEDQRTINTIYEAISKVKSKLKTNYPIEEKELFEIINKYCLKNDTLLEPSKYQEVVKQSEVNKIINRLNAGNIDENNNDYIKNKQFIKYKIVNNKKVYYTDSFTFTKEELEECSKYIAYLTVIKQFNSSIMPYIKQIPVEIDDDMLKNITLDFNDENYIFDQESLKSLKLEDAGDIYEYIDDIANLKPEYREHLFRLLFDEDLLMRILTDKLYDLSVVIWHESKDEDELFLINLIQNINRLPELINLEDLTITNYSKIKRYLSILQSLSIEDIRKLGPTIINMTVDNDAFNPRGLTTVEKLQRTNSLYDRMITKKEFTVPRINGLHNNILFEVMKQDDPHFLTCGFETDACFRVGGHDNDFLHYCALNKNGFVIKLTDSDGNFLGRASGFRNGNTIYLNQLRTIYDISGNRTKHIPKNVKMELIYALKACTDEIIRESAKSDEPIDYAIITKAYSIEECDIDMFGTTVDNDVEFDLSDTPVNTTTEDWEEFRHEEGVNLAEEESSFPFDTDYCGYKKFVLSTREPKKTIITRADIRSYNPKAIYRVEKEKTQNCILTLENYEYFDKINKRNAAINGETYHPIDKDLIGCFVSFGSDWYVLEGESGIIGDSFDHRKQFPDESIIAKYMY